MVLQLSLLKGFLTLTRVEGANDIYSLSLHCPDTKLALT